MKAEILDYMSNSSGDLLNELRDIFKRTLELFHEFLPGFEGSETSSGYMVKRTDTSGDLTSETGVSLSISGEKYITATYLGIGSAANGPWNLPTFQSDTERDKRLNRICVSAISPLLHS